LILIFVFWTRFWTWSWSDHEASL